MKNFLFLENNFKFENKIINFKIILCINLIYILIISKLGIRTLTLVSKEPQLWLKHTLINPKKAKNGIVEFFFKHIIKNFDSFPKK